MRGCVLCAVCCVRTTGDTSGANILLSKNIKSSITDRIDKLDANAALVLKLCSVFGTEVPFDGLRELIKQEPGAYADSVSQVGWGSTLPPYLCCLCFLSPAPCHLPLRCIE